MSFMETKEAKFSILVFPWLAYSHIFPYLELSKRLSKSNFHIYLCSSAVNLDLIHKDLSDNPSIEPVELQLPSLPDLPPQFHTTKNLPSNLMPILQQAFQMSTSSFSKILNTLKPDLLIYDFFQPWAARLASSQGIPPVYFATSGATAFSYFHHVYTYGNFSNFPYPEIHLLEHEKRDQLSMVDPRVKVADEDFGNDIFKLSCGIVLVKSLRDVEGKCIDYLSSLCHKKVLPTGPLVQEPSNTDDESCSDILNWLSKKDPFSTVFLCFGSEHFLSTKQILEVAKGLELCDANFIWIIRFPLEAKSCHLEDVLPADFLDRVKERGMFVEGWAPQSKILSHPAIGGFVSHCGWSSIMESLYFGVPIIALPIKYDQPINARLVVDAGVGVEIENGENGHLTGEEVANAINKVFLEKTAEGMRQRTKTLSDRMKQREDEAVNYVSEQLLELCMKKQQHKSLSSSGS